MNSARANQYAGKLFLLYFAVITVMLIWGLFHCTEISWTPRNVYAEAGADSEKSGKSGSSVELLDDRPLEAVTAGAFDSGKGIDEKTKLYGVSILGYENTHGLRFTQEMIRMEVVDSDSREVLGSGSLLLRDHTPYPGDGTQMYIPLTEPVAGTQKRNLLVRFSTEGLTRNGITFHEDTAGAEAGTEEEPVLAELYYQKTNWNPFMYLVFFFLEAAVGLACLGLFNKRVFPLTLSGEEKNQPRGRGAVLQKRDICKLVLVLGIAFLMISYTYIHVVRKTAVTSSGEFLVPAKGAEESITLHPGDSVRQIIIPGKDKLSGIGVRLEKEDSGGQTDPVLVWALCEEGSTEVLSEGSAPLSELKKVKSVLTGDTEDEDLAAAAADFVHLPLERTVEEAADRRLVLEMKMQEQEADEETALVFTASGQTNGFSQYKGAGNTKEQGAVSVDGTEADSPLEICLIGLYRNNAFLKGMFLAVGAVLLVMTCGLFFASKLYKDRAACMYLCSALCMGMIFSFMTPAYTISDERTHIDTVYIVSNRLLGINDEPGPLRAYRRACDVDTSIANTMPVTVQRYRAAATELFRPAETDAVNGSSGKELTAAYSRNAITNVPMLCYVPAALGFTIARLSGRNMITMIMFARWFNLIAGVLIIRAALRRMPYGAACMAAVALFPKTLQMMASCSYDGMIIAGTFLFIAYALAAVCEDNYSIIDLMVLLLSGFYVASCKGGVFLPVLCIVFMIPFAGKGRAAGKKKRKIWTWIIAAIPGSAVLLFAFKYVRRVLGLLGRDSSAATAALGSRKVYSLADFVHSPLKLVRIFVNTISVRGDGLVGELVGKNLSQKWYLVYAFIVLAILGVLSRKLSAGTDDGNTLTAEGGRGRLRTGGKVWIFFLAVCSTALIFLSMLVAFTSKGMGYIEGLQGRYFLPVAPLIFLAADNNAVRRDGFSDGTLLYTADILLVITFCEIMMYYIGGA